MNKSSKKHIAKAHDHFFRMSMSDKRVAREFFAVHLPSDLLQVIDLNQLELQSGTFIDDMRQESIADMLFKVMLDGHEAYLFLIVDHQSRPDELMPFRCLKYTCNFIDQHLKGSTTKRIPLVFPMVVYHGKQSWTYSVDINDLVDAPNEVVKAYFLKPFQFIDLSLIKDETLKKHTWAGVMELALKHIFARSMLPYIRDIIELLKRLEQLDGKNLAENVLVYILDRGELGNKKSFIDMVKTEFSPKIGEKIMTISEQFKAEGIQQGIQQGIEKGMHQVAMKLLKENYTIEFIAKITGLYVNEIELLKEQVTN